MPRFRSIAISRIRRNLDHGFGSYRRLLGKAGAGTVCQNNHLKAHPGHKNRRQSPPFRRYQTSLARASRQHPNTPKFAPVCVASAHRNVVVEWVTKHALMRKTRRGVNPLSKAPDLATAVTKASVRVKLGLRDGQA
jgi:hypothetical protein